MLITILIALVILALAIYAVQTFLPGDARLKSLICFVLVVAALVYVLRAAGVV